MKSSFISYCRKHREKVQVALDLLIVTISYLLAFVVENGFNLSFGLLSNKVIIAFACLVYAVYVTVFYILGIYRGVWKYFGLVEMKLKLEIKKSENIFLYFSPL